MYSKGPSCHQCSLSVFWFDSMIQISSLWFYLFFSFLFLFGIFTFFFHSLNFCISCSFFPFQFLGLCFFSCSSCFDLIISAAVSTRETFCFLFLLEILTCDSGMGKRCDKLFVMLVSIIVLVDATEPVEGKLTVGCCGPSTWIGSVAVSSKVHVTAGAKAVLGTAALFSR